MLKNVLGIIALVIGAILAVKVLLVLFHLVGILIVSIGTIVWIAALVHICLQQFPAPINKILWFVAVFFTHVLGAIVYFLFGRPAKSLVA